MNNNNQLIKRRRFMTASTFAQRHRRPFPFICLEFSHISHSSHTNRRCALYMIVHDFWVSIANCIHIWCNRTASIVPCCSSSIHFSLSVSKQNRNCTTTSITPRSLNTHHCSHWRHCSPLSTCFFFRVREWSHTSSMQCLSTLNRNNSNEFFFYIFNFKRT